MLGITFFSNWSVFKKPLYQKGLYVKQLSGRALRVCGPIRRLPMTALAWMPSLRRIGVDERSLENFYGGMRKSVRSNLKRIKAILFIPYTKIHMWRKKSLLAPNENLLPNENSIRDICNSQGTQYIRQWQRERENKFKICFGGWIDRRWLKQAILYNKPKNRIISFFQSIVWWS